MFPYAVARPGQSFSGSTECRSGQNRGWDRGGGLTLLVYPARDPLRRWISKLNRRSLPSRNTRPPQREQAVDGGGPDIQAAGVGAEGGHHQAAAVEDEAGAAERCRRGPGWWPWGGGGRRPPPGRRWRWLRGGRPWDRRRGLRPRCRPGRWGAWGRGCPAPRQSGGLPSSPAGGSARSAAGGWSRRRRERSYRATTVCGDQRRSSSVRRSSVAWVSQGGSSMPRRA